MKSFYVTLPSNGSMDVFPENTLTQFRNKLPRSLHLDGEWDVGLIECMYPFSWFQISPETSKLYKRNVVSNSEWINIPLQNVKSIFNEEALVKEKFLEPEQRPWLRLNDINDNGQLRLASSNHVQL